VLFEGDRAYWHLHHDGEEAGRPIEPNRHDGAGDGRLNRHSCETPILGRTSTRSCRGSAYWLRRESTGIASTAGPQLFRLSRSPSRDATNMYGQGRISLYNSPPRCSRTVPRGAYSCTLDSVAARRESF
jgi:hypothetical protein